MLAPLTDRRGLGAQKRALRSLGTGLGRRFRAEESRRARATGQDANQDASVAQLAEQLICNQQVAGSSPAAGSMRNRAAPGC